MGLDDRAVARDVSSPVWSPDDRWIFARRGGVIVRMAVNGTAVAPLRFRFVLPREFEYDLLFLP